MKKITLIRENPPPRRSEHPSYETAHQRIYMDRGRAKDYACVDCTGQAYDWSYNGGSPRELLGAASRGRPTLSPYSPDPHDYSPRCRACHIRHDRAAA